VVTQPPLRVVTQPPLRVVTQPPILLGVLIADWRSVVKEQSDAANRAVGCLAFGAKAVSNHRTPRSLLIGI
jgi:hypothetical protein